MFRAKKEKPGKKEKQKKAALPELGKLSLGKKKRGALPSAGVVAETVPAESSAGEPIAPRKKPRVATDRSSLYAGAVFFGILLALGFVLTRQRAQRQVESVDVTGVQAPQGETTEVDEFLKLEREARERPRDVQVLLKLAQAYEQQENVGMAYLIFRRIAYLAPNRPEGQVAKEWLKSKATETRKYWFSAPGKQFQDVSQYAGITLDLASITQRVGQKAEAVKKSAQAAQEEDQKALQGRKGPEATTPPTAAGGETQQPAFLLVPVTDPTQDKNAPQSK